MSKIEPLQFGKYYHIYNRGNNRETLFRSAENYRFFLKRYAQHIEPVAKTYAYNLLPNHFHFSIYVRTPTEQAVYHQSCQLSESWQLLNPSRAFANLCTSYSKAYNKRFKRSGSLFEKPFKRKSVSNRFYFLNLLTYINQNAVKHRIVDDVEDWPWSSYGTMLKSGATRLERVQVIDWFGDQQAFVRAQHQPVNEKIIEKFLFEDDD